MIEQRPRFEGPGSARAQRPPPESHVHGLRPFDPTILSHPMFGTVFSVAIHGDWMSSGITGPPGLEAYLDEMATLTVYGLYDKSHRDGSGEVER